MARIALGALTTLNLSTHLDPMFIELYALRSLFSASGANAYITAGNTFGLGANPPALGGTGPILELYGASTQPAITMHNAASGLTASRGAMVRLNQSNLEIRNYEATGAISLATNDVERVRVNAPGSDADVVVTGSARFNGAIATAGSLNGMQAGTSGGFPAIRWVYSTAAADQKVWDSYANANTLAFRAVNDANTIATEWMSVIRAGTSVTGINFYANVKPFNDNAVPLGAAATRWSVVYAGTGAINTSDAREKTAVAPLMSSEIAAAKDLAREVGAFQFLDAVKAKGEGARLHIGMTVQRAIEIMEAHGLEADRYGFICYDEWEAEGDTPAGSRYGFRVDELLLFIARGFEARLSALEAA